MNVSFYSVILCRKPVFEDICAVEMEDESIGGLFEFISAQLEDELDEFIDDFIDFGRESKTCGDGFCTKDVGSAPLDFCVVIDAGDNQKDKNGDNHPEIIDLYTWNSKLT